MTTVIDVEGMSCDGCEEIVADSLEEVAGVESATADHEADRATVEGDADADALLDAVDFAGYEGELAEAAAEEAGEAGDEAADDAAGESADAADEGE